MSFIKAKGVVVRSPGAPALLEDIALEAPGPNEVLVRVLAAGICHSDLHTQQGNFGREFPYLLGHEATGIIEAVGPAVSNSRIGEIVTLCWRAPCGNCRFCSAGKAEYCAKPLVANPRMRTQDGQVLGRVLGLGALATHTIVHSAQAISLPFDVAPEISCLLGCAVTTGVGAVLYAAKVEAGSTVAVFGCGAVGISAIQGARLAHASRIIAVDRIADKLALASRFGATDVVDASQSVPSKEIKRLTSTGVDYAFDAVGLPETMGEAMASCDLSGTCILIGVPAPKAELSTSLSRLFYSRLTLRSTFYGDILPSRDFALFAELYRSGKLDLEGLVTSRLDLSEAPDAFAKLERGEGLRAVVIMA